MKTNCSNTLIDIIHKGEKIEKGHYKISIIQEFDQAVFSWNLDLNPNEIIDISFYVEEKKEKSRVYHLASWSEAENRRSYAKQTGAFGTLKTDVFHAEKKVDTIHIFLKSNMGNVSKEPRGLFISTLKNHIVEENDITEIQMSRYDVPALVQYPVESIGKRICSPTSCAMLLEYMGTKVTLEEMARRVYDTGADIYGNWAFNVAAMSEFGYCAYARYFNSVSELSAFVKAYGPVAVSVKTKESRGFTDALQPYPNGHLLVVKGFIQKNNRGFVMVNDPADFDQKSSQRIYALEEFKKYWKCIAYILEKQEKS